MQCFVYNCKDPTSDFWKVAMVPCRVLEKSILGSQLGETHNLAHTPCDLRQVCDSAEPQVRLLLHCWFPVWVWLAFTCNEVEVLNTGQCGWTTHPSVSLDICRTKPASFLIRDKSPAQLMDDCPFAFPAPSLLISSTLLFVCEVSHSGHFVGVKSDSAFFRKAELISEHPS